MNQSGSSESERLPFDIVAVLIGVYRRKVLLFLWLLVSMAGGLGAGWLLGTRTWDSYCVMLFQPPSVELSGRVYESPHVQTQLNLVKLRPHLEEVRARLNLPVELDTLASSCDVTNPRDTQLLIIKNTWNDARQSAAIANTLADVFMSSQQRVRHDELSDALEYLEGRKQQLQAKLDSFKKRREEQGTPEREPEDLEREIRSAQTKLDALDVIYEKALSERKALKQKVDKIAALIDETKQKIADEKEEAAAVQGLSNLNIRVERIREAIMDDRQERTNDITLEQWRKRLEYDKQLLDRGYLSKAMYDHELAQFEKLQAQAVDTDQIAEWKTELQDLYKKIRPSNKKETVSAPILRDLMMRSFNLQLEFDGVNETINKTKDSREQIAAQLEALLASRHQAGGEGWQVTAWREELTDTDRSIAMVQSMQGSSASDYQVVSAAEEAPKPASANRRLLAIGVSGLLGMFGFVLIVGREFLRTQVRTAEEVKLVSEQPVLGVLPRRSSSSAESLRHEQAEQIRRVANLITRSPGGGRTLVLGCHHGDGCSTVAADIAACLARQRRKVLLLDGDLRSPRPGINEIHNLPAEAPGLGELLANPNEVVPQAVLEPQAGSSLSVLPRGNASVAPELLGSSRMAEIIKSLADTHENVVLDGPPLCDYTDAEYLAAHVDSVLLVVRSAACLRADLKLAAQRLRDSGKQILGVILNDVDPIYLRFVPNL